MRRILRPLALVVAVGSVYAACAKVPYSNRRQFNIIPGVAMNTLGKSSYDSLLAESRVAKRGEDAEVLRRIGRRMTRASGESKYEWTYKLIHDETMNAFCLPGGYIAFYTGILPVLENEASVAFVMGHEIGHVVAHHGAERLSQQLTVLGGLAGLTAIINGQVEMTDEQAAVVAGALGLGATYGVLLPFSRKHEHEADVIGMMTMAKAGYPPEESTKVWTRMERESGSSHMAFLSTHPSYEKRKEVQREWMPKAAKRYARNKLDYDTTSTTWDYVPSQQGLDKGRTGSKTTTSGSEGGSSSGSGSSDEGVKTRPK